jgi:hypothetical protein
MRCKFDSNGRMITRRTFTSVPAISSPHEFDVPGYRSASSASTFMHPNAGSGQTSDYQPASTGLYFWKHFDHAGAPCAFSIKSTVSTGLVYCAYRGLDAGKGP